MTVRKKSIGVFDSGVGGLTVLKELLEILPDENFIYFGDTARVPYGARPAAEIRKFTREILCFLAEQEIKLAVIACNTITFNINPPDLAVFPFPVIGMDDCVKAARAVSKTKTIGVIATPATIASAKHIETGKETDPELKVYLKACPEFVPIIERGIFDGPELEAVASEYLRHLQEAKIDSLILACTHYPLISHLIGRILGPKIQIINPARETALNTLSLLTEKNWLNPALRAGKLRLVFSSLSSATENILRLFMQRSLPELELNDLSAYGDK